jgi:hypothetical protein
VRGTLELDVQEHRIGNIWEYMVIIEGSRANVDMLRPLEFEISNGIRGNYGKPICLAKVHP